MENFSVLLGAGFSRPEGYPLVSDLNASILNLNKDNCYIDGVGTLILKDIHEPDHGLHSTYNYDKLFFVELSKWYNDLIQQFDYEKFYDFLFNQRKASTKHTNFDSFFNSFKEKHTGFSGYVHDLLDRSLMTLSQAVKIYLVNGNQQRWYPDVHLSKPLLNYDGFLSIIEKASKSMPINIHTLNHDLFFESLANSDYINCDFSDGFTMDESPFTGEDFRSGDQVKLKYFNNQFKKAFNLFKLHGSIDYYPFHGQTMGAATIDSYIKIQKGVNPMELYRNFGKQNEERDWVNYESTFLSGTTTKILSYNAPILFKELFLHFETNIRNAKVLFVIGYSATDARINEIIYSNLSSECKVFITAKNPSQDQSEFIRQTRATVIPKYVQDLELTDFEL